MLIPCHNLFFAAGWNGERGVGKTNVRDEDYSIRQMGKKPHIITALRNNVRGVHWNHHVSVRPFVPDFVRTVSSVAVLVVALQKIATYLQQQCHLNLSTYY